MNNLVQNPLSKMKDDKHSKGLRKNFVTKLFQWSKTGALNLMVPPNQNFTPLRTPKSDLYPLPYPQIKNST